jgi:hypothetical protein
MAKATAALGFRGWRSALPASVPQPTLPPSAALASVTLVSAAVALLPHAPLPAPCRWWRRVMDSFKIEDIYNDGFEAEAEVIKQERAQVQQAQAAPPSPVLITPSPSKKRRGNAAVKLETPRQLVDHLPDAEAEVSSSIGPVGCRLTLDLLLSRP